MGRAETNAETAGTRRPTHHARGGVARLTGGMIANFTKVVRVTHASGVPATRVGVWPDEGSAGAACRKMRRSGFGVCVSIADFEKFTSSVQLENHDDII